MDRMTKLCLVDGMVVVTDVDAMDFVIPGPGTLSTRGTGDSGCGCIADDDEDEALVLTFMTQ